MASGEDNTHKGLFSFQHTLPTNGCIQLTHITYCGYAWVCDIYIYDKLCRDRRKKKNQSTRQAHDRDTQTAQRGANTSFTSSNKTTNNNSINYDNARERRHENPPTSNSKTTKNNNKKRKYKKQMIQYERDIYVHIKITFLTATKRPTTKKNDILRKISTYNVKRKTCRMKKRVCVLYMNVCMHARSA